MTTGISVSKTNAAAVIGPKDLSVAKANAAVVYGPKDLAVSKANAAVVVESLYPKVTQVVLQSAIEATPGVDVTQVTNAPVIEAIASKLVTQVTLALVIPRSLYPPEDYDEPYPCSVNIDRVSTELICLDMEESGIATLDRVATGMICAALTPKEYVCLSRVSNECMNLTRVCDNE